MTTYRQRCLHPGAAHAADTIAQLGQQLSRDAVTVLAVASLHADLDPSRSQGYVGHTVAELQELTILDEDEVQYAVAELVRLGALVPRDPRALSTGCYRIPEHAFDASRGVTA